MRTSPETPDEEHTIPWDVALAGIGLLVAVLVWLLWGGDLPRDD